MVRDRAACVVRAFRPRFGDRRDRRDFGARAFFSMRSMVIFSWSFLAAAGVSHAFSWRLPSAPVQRAKYFP
jgi:hypothetical protein